MSMQGKTRVKVWLVLIGVFLLGSVTGAALDAVYRMRTSAVDNKPGERHAKYFEKMQRELSLNEEQSAKIKTILDDARTEYRALRDEARPRYDAIRQKERERIRGVLNTEQQQKFDQMTARKDAERAKHDRDVR